MSTDFFATLELSSPGAGGPVVLSLDTGEIAKIPPKLQRILGMACIVALRRRLSPALQTLGSDLADSHAIASAAVEVRATLLEAMTAMVVLDRPSTGVPNAPTATAPLKMAEQLAALVSTRSRSLHSALSLWNGTAADRLLAAELSTLERFTRFACSRQTVLAQSGAAGIGCSMSNDDAVAAAATAASAAEQAHSIKMEYALCYLTDERLAPLSTHGTRSDLSNPIPH